MAGERGGVRLADQQPMMSGGLNTVSDDVALQPTQLRKANNARLTDFGAVAKRGGTQRITSAVIASAPILGGFTWRKDNGTRQILTVCNGTLSTMTYGGFPLTVTPVTGALSTVVPTSFAQFRDGTNDVVYIADGDFLNVWNGTTLTTNLAGTAQVETIAVHNQRLWGCGNSTYSDSIFYSALNNGSTLGVGASGGGQIVVRTFGDEIVVGLASVGTSLLIFHRRGVSRLTGFGQDDITVAPAGLTSDVGTIAPKSIVSIGNLAFFVSERGLFKCNESDVASVSTADSPDPLLPLIRNMTSAQLAAIRAEFNRATRELWISLPGVGVYTYHVILGAWAGPWDGGYLSPGVTALWETLDSNGLPVMLKGDSTGWITLCDAPGAYTDNVSASGTAGSTFTMDVQMRRMYCGDEALEKALRWAYVTANLKGSTQCSVRWNTGSSTGSYTMPASAYGVWSLSSTWSSSLFWGVSSSSSYRVPLGGTGYFVDLSVVDSSTSTPVISKMQLETFSLGRR